MDKIRQEQRRNLRLFLWLSIAMTGLLCILGFALPILSRPRYGYLLCVGALLLLAGAVHCWKRNAAVVLETYAFCAIILALTIYLGVSTGPDTLPVSFTALFCLMPVIVLDRERRKSLLIFLCLVIHSAVMFAFKSTEIALGGTVISLCTTAVGIVSGVYTQRTKLMNLELMRLSDENGNRDFLTGLYNRCRLFARLKESESGAAPRIAGMLMLDVDNYKSFNDHYGHLAGDACLKKLGAYLWDFGAARGLEVYRYGGEEMLLLCYDETAGYLEALAQELLSGVRGLNIPFAAAEAGIVTVSIGYADCPKHGAGYETVIDRADLALYQAKAQGRGCTVGYTPELAERLRSRGFSASRRS